MLQRSSPQMNDKRVIVVLACLLVIGLCVTVSIGPRADPKDLSYWLRAARGKDWSAEAARGGPEAQFFLGLTLIRTNLITRMDRVPLLSAVPLIGRRFVEVTHAIDNSIGQERLAEAFRWMERSAESGYAPAIEAKKLFIGRVVPTTQSMEQSGHSPEKPRERLGIRNGLVQARVLSSPVTRGGCATAFNAQPETWLNHEARLTVRPA